ncbi:discoidin domain-containing protein [Luteolibacter soli]|uniref:Discoidin domain-containing protein n=1 Tax=Luteolibacter soli TaxID=3135280 RepID=A0ABU9B1E0_9BACT
MKKTLEPRIGGRTLPLIPSLLALAAASTVISHAAEVTFQYYRFTPTKVDGGDAATATQMSEFEFFLRGNKLDVSSVVVTGGVTFPNPGDAESAQKLVDGNVNTKWFDGNKVPVTFNFGTPVKIDAYRFATANDSRDRTPVRWLIQGSNDNVNFVLIDDRTGADNAAAKSYFTFGPLFTTTPPASSGYPTFASFQTTASIVDNTVAGQDVYQAFPLIVKNAGPETSMSWSVTNTPTGVSFNPALPAPAINFTDTRLITPIIPNAFTDYTLSATTAAGTAALTQKIRAVPGGTATTRYVRFKANELRNPLGNIAQMGEFEFFNGATKLTGLTVTNPGGDNNNNAGEAASKVIDGDYRTKYLNHNNAALIFDLGSVQTFDGYQFTTGNDATDRDPVRWSLETSSDGITWTLLDTAYDYSPPTIRRAKTGIIPLSGIPTATWAGSTTVFTNGGNVLLDDSSSVRGVVLDTPVSPNAVSIASSTGDPYMISGAPISGRGDLFKRGSGELQLNSPNTFSGAINADGGKLVVNDSGALGTRNVRTRLQLDSTELQIATDVRTERRLRIAANGATINVADGFTFTKVGPSDLLGTLTKTGPGTLRFEGYAGSTSFAATDIVVNEGTVDFAAAAGYFNSRPFTTSGSSTMKMTVNTGAQISFSIDSALGGDYVNFQTSLEQVRVIGGTLNFNNGGFNYIHTGLVGTEGRIVLQGGTLTGGGQIEPAGLTAANPVTTTFTSLASADSSFITGGGALALNPDNCSLTLDVADGAATDDLVVTKRILGNKRLTKTGAGNLVLTGANELALAPVTYTNPTGILVSAGTLTANNSTGSATGTSPVTMSAGTKLQGIGSALSNITTPGIIAPGDANTPTGTLTVGNTVLTGTLEIGSEGESADKLAVNGTLNITGAALTLSGTFNAPAYQIVSSTGGITGTFNATGVPAGYTLQYSTNSIVLVSNTATAYQVWSAGLSDPDPEADIDGDGMANVIEFVLNSNPNASSLADLPHSSTNPAGALVFTFVRKSSSAYLAPTVEYSTTLASWTTFGGAVVQPNTPSSGLDTVTATLPASLAAPGFKLFARLKVEVP